MPDDRKKLALGNRTAAVARAVARRQSRWKRRFISALSKAPSVKAACAAAGISRDAAYDNRRRDPQFAAAWQAAIDLSIDQVESQTIQFVLDGPSDNGTASAWASLAMFLLKSHKRSVYGDKIEAAFAGGLVILPPKKRGPE
jgi:hypothetical protein